MDHAPFATRRRLVLGLRAAGLFLVGLGIAAPGLLVGLVIQAAMSRAANEPFAAFGLIDRVGQVLGSKEFLLRWLGSAGLWIVSLALGLYLLRRSAPNILRIAGRGGA